MWPWRAVCARSCASREWSSCCTPGAALAWLSRRISLALMHRMQPLLVGSSKISLTNEACSNGKGCFSAAVRFKDPAGWQQARG